MKNQPRKCTAIKSLLFLALMSTGALACAAQAAGTVINMSGPLLAKKADGTIRILAIKSAVEPGDTLVTQKNGYAQIKFSDDSRLILQPDTTVTIEQFSYDQARPDGDSATFNLANGGLRSVTGLLGKRNKEKFTLKTPTATVGIRGTTFIAQWVPPPPPPGGGVTRQDLMNDLLNNSQPGKSPTTRGGSAGGDLASANLPVSKQPHGGTRPSAPPGPPILPPGLHLQVADGAIVVTNTGGSLGFQAGQFGYVPNVNQPPVIVPSNPGLQFVPPPSFDRSLPTGGGNANPGDSRAVDCIVR